MHIQNIYVVRGITDLNHCAGFGLNCLYCNRNVTGQIVDLKGNRVYGIFSNEAVSVRVYEEDMYDFYSKAVANGIT